MPEQDTPGSRDDILVLNDPSFSTANVCVVAGAATNIGRATAVAAAANQLMTVGLDADEAGGRLTQRLARESGGQMIFIKSDMTDDGQLTHAVEEAAKLGAIKFLVNTVAEQPAPALLDGMSLADFDAAHRRTLRTPLLLSKLVSARMFGSGDGTGVVGNVVFVDTTAQDDRRPGRPLAVLGLRALSGSINAAGEGRIRSFTIDADDWNRAAIASRIAPVAVANAVVFGLSRFAGHFVQADFRRACG